MGLSARLQRSWYVWSWRIRFWWFDTPSGEYSRWFACGLAAVIAVLKVTHSYVDAALSPPAPDEPYKAIVWWIWAIIVLAAAAAASMAMMPKQKPPKPQEGEAPSVEDGKAVIHHFGECWIENEFILAWKVVGKEKIKAKSGKK